MLALVDAPREDLALLAVDERDLLQHREGVVPRLVIAPLEDPLAPAREALMDAVDDDVVVARRPGLRADVDPVHEDRIHEVGVREVVPAEGVRGAGWIETLDTRAPGPAVERHAAEAPAEPAVHELRARREPTVQIRVGEAAALEARLARAHAAKVRAVEAAVAEDALPPAREERLPLLPEGLAPEIAALEHAAVRAEPIERGVAEVRVADRYAVHEEDALHATGRALALSLPRRAMRRRSSSGRSPSWCVPRRRRPSRSSATAW